MELKTHSISEKRDFLARDRIWQELKQCSAERAPDSQIRSQFIPRSASTIDINGRLEKERGRNEGKPLRPGKSVKFPGIHLGPDPHKRWRWIMLRDLYRRTYHTFSWIDLDRTFTENTLITRFIIPNDKPNINRVIDLTESLLGRLPSTPPPLPDGMLNLTGELMESCWLKIDTSAYSWDQLSTVSNLPTCVIRMGIAIALTYNREPDANVSDRESHNFGQFLDFISDLIDGAFFELQKGPVEKDGKFVSNTWRWFILITYLWGAWHRCLALHYWRVLQDSLETGFDYTGFGELGLRPNRGSFLLLESQRTPNSQCKSPYMCNLAYQILYRSRSTFLLDLREFHKRFGEAFRGKPGRCVGDSACSGLGPDHCRRIRGAKVLDQTQHDLSCTDEGKCNSSRMIWNRDSYLRVKGARAVSILSSSDQLCYKEADTETLAISHVWSHGQGGRPEEGMNGCLHYRYCKIAQDFGCSSYWIDTACIPSDHNLRREAILTINHVFSTSKATVLCDRDLMDLDVSKIFDGSNTRDGMALRESILAIVLVCDWNVRAWTLLEALRGRKNIQLLCKSNDANKLVSLTETLRTVASHGSITISILLLTNHHLFPAPNPRNWMKLKTHSRELSKFQNIVFESSFDADVISGRIGRGFITVSEAASLLGQRFASRPGDDVIIWSLLVDDDVHEDAWDMWARGKHGGVFLDGVVHTSHLLSSVRRLGPNVSHQGPSWAPKQPGPYLAANERSPTSELYPPYDGVQPRIGMIEMDKERNACLRASWGVATIHFEHGFASYYRSFCSSREVPLNRPVPDRLKEYLKDYKEGKLLHPLSRGRAHAGNEEVHGELCASIYGGYKGVSKGLLFAICGKNDNRGAWTWLGVIDWGADGSLPIFEEEDIDLG